MKTIKELLTQQTIFLHAWTCSFDVIMDFEDVCIKKVITIMTLAHLRMLLHGKSENKLLVMLWKSISMIISYSHRMV